MSAPIASSAVLPREGQQQRALSWLPFVAVVVVHAALTLYQIGLPGVYMDAVSPDYLVVKILNPQHEPIVAWVVRGNYLFGHRIPVLIQLYHGALPFWFGLPFFWLFGTTVEGLRLTHGIAALVILAALYALLIRSSLRPWQAAAACLALALDPVFSFAFRTQSYITLANTAWILVSVTLLAAAARTAVASRAIWQCAASGFFAGLAVYGYFVFAFYLPVLFVAALHVGAMSAGIASKRSLPLWWLGGVALGASGYALGYGLMLGAAGGIPAFLDYLSGQNHTLNAFGSTLGFADRVAFSWRMVDWAVSNTWHHSLVFGEPVPVQGRGVKLALLIVLPYGLWLLAELRRVATPVQRMLVALPACFFACSLVFGSRLGGHHFMSVVPLLYGALAVGLHGLQARLRHVVALPVGIAAIAALLSLNAHGQYAARAKLAETGGVGLFSDAINRLAQDLNGMATKPYVVSADWGLAFPIAFLTRGEVPLTATESPDAARKVLCEGRDVAIAMINGDRAARTRTWQSSLGWEPPTVRTYRQRNGKPVFDLVTFAGQRAAPACATDRR